MTPQKFLIQLFAVTLGCVPLLFALDLFPSIQPHRLFSAFSLFFFWGLSIVLYVLGKVNLSTGNPQDFLRFFMLSVFLKMGLCIGVILGYRHLFHPPGNRFILPFFMLYGIFTIYEVYFLSKLSSDASK